MAAQDFDTGHPDYDLLKDIGSGNFGVAKLMRYKPTGELVAVKFIERGDKIDKNVEREIVNHRTLLHPNIIKFREVFLTSTHLAIVMEYAAGGELFDRIVKAGRFSEDEARFFFQQLVAGVDYCHSEGVCHRDLKLENTLLDGRPAPRLKICDFGYSKSAVFDSQPKSTVGTPAYIAPEVLSRKQYDGEIADVWSCGVTLYVMLVGAYPFEDPQDPRNFRKTIQRIMSVKYSFPSNLQLSRECLDLISQVFVANPANRVTLKGLKQHPWFLQNLPDELKDGGMAVRDRMTPSHQSVEHVRRVVREAQHKVAGGPAPPVSEFNEEADDCYMADEHEISHRHGKCCSGACYYEFRAKDTHTVLKLSSLTNMMASTILNSSPSVFRLQIKARSRRCMVVSASVPINPDIKKDTDKVVDTVSTADLKGKAVYCRCWRSATFPLCNASHVKWNKETGDNVGPLIVVGAK